MDGEVGLQEGVKAGEGGVDGAFAGAFLAHDFCDAVEGGLALLAGKLALFADDVVDG